MLYDENWNVMDEADANLKTGHIVTVLRKTVLAPARDDTVVWDIERGFRRIVHVPEDAKYEECRQYVHYTAEENIAMYQKNLSDTDYVAAKMAEAVALGDSETLDAYKDKYAGVLAKRKEWREAIDTLQSEVSAGG